MNPLYRTTLRTTFPFFCLADYLAAGRHLLVLTFALLLSQSITASDVTEVLPVTDRILRVYLVDGHIDSYGPGESYQDNVTYVSATDIARATTLSNYSIISSDDPNYASAKNPIHLGRKSKAEDYNSQYQEVPYVWGHWIYLELPQPMTPGKTYTLALNDVVENQPTVTFTYDVRQLRSPAVHVNMVGFPAAGPKYAYLSQWMGDFNSSTHQQGGLELDAYAGNQFRLIHYATGATAFTGTIAKRLDKTSQETKSGDYAPEFNYSHADVWECDFSSFSTPGEYVVAVDGLGCSYPFEIGNNVTHEPFYYAMKGLFWQRQGIVKQMEDGQVMPRDHHPDDLPWQWDKNWPGGEDVSTFDTSAPQVKGIWGYYHDAGDWDGYTTHARVPMLLCLLYDLAPDRFKDGEMDNRYKLSPSDANWIDESTNGLPDLLDEASWLIKYFRRARTVLQDQYGGTGGVPGYVGRDALPGNLNNITAWQDTREWYLSAENVEQTYYYAGLAAWYALCLNKFHQLSQSGNHPEYNAWMSEAQAAWDWAAGRPLSTDNERRARGLAAANLYRTTAQAAYQSAFEEYYAWEPNKGDGEWGNSNLYDLALSVYSFIPADQAGLNVSLQNQCKTEIETKATSQKVDALNANGFRCAMEEYQFFLLGPFSTPKLTLLPVAHKISGDDKYLEAIQNATNYVLGGNQLNYTYLSGLGEASDEWIFNPNGWLTNDYNSKVYANEPFIGYTSYFGAVDYWFFNGINSEYWSKDGAYPQAKNSPNEWPEAESKFRNRYSIQGGEFTVHQQNNYMIYTMGYVKAQANTAVTGYTLNARPTLSLNLADGATVPTTGATLQVDASPDTRRVAYYYEWHYIGESTDPASNFAVNWAPPLAPGTEVLLTAVGYDDRGRRTVPRDAGDQTVVISETTAEDGNEPAFSGTGLTYSVYGGTSLSGSPLRTGVDTTVNFNGQSAGKAPDLPKDNFSVRWAGQVQPRYGEAYTFYTRSDDGVRLWVNGQLLIDNWTDHAVQEDQGRITLQAGKKYEIVLEYYENRGKAVCQLGWSSARQSKQNIPQQHLYPGDSNARVSTSSFSEPTGTGKDQGAVTVYPNPLAKGELTLQLGAVATGELEVRDALGRLVLHRSFREQRQLTLTKEELTKGMLLLMIRTPKGYQQTKFLVE